MAHIHIDQHCKIINVRRQETSLRFLQFCFKQSASFVNEILWTNECQFTKRGIVHNTHYLSLENRRAIYSDRHQIRWSVNVWSGKWSSI